MDRLAIVILNYNGLSFLERFLPSVITHADGATVYVADNASADGSVAFLSQNFPTVRLIELPTNAGYTGGYNQALAQIEAHYYVLLNSDIAVTPGWIAPILALLDANPAMAACQPKLLAYQQPTHFEYAGGAGGYLDFLGYAFCRGRLFDTLEIDHGQYDDNQPVFWASGACLFVRARVFHELGGFDDAFFAHQEEVDWCWRAQQRGYQIWTCGESVIYHVGGGTLHKSNPRKTFLNYRNSLFMLYKNLPGSELVPILFTRLVLDGVAGVKLLFQGHWRDTLAIIQAHGAFYQQIASLRVKRRAGQQQATTTVRRYPHSVVWQYFISGRHLFSQLPAIPPLPNEAPYHAH